ncbi:MAG TPA: hypothetical protein VN181_08025 [Thermoanaerobaculia bacterium]|nr:hypothetical protein [Thermoanaerobaculia bacterium]
MIENAIGTAVAAHGFKSGDNDAYRAAGFPHVWLRQTLNSNRAVALWTPPANVPLAASCQQAKWDLLAHTFSIVFLYPLGVQLIAVADGILDAHVDLADSVDKIDNQRVVLQGIFLVDTRARRFVYWSSPFLRFTKKFHASIAEGLRDAGLASRE